MQITVKVVVSVRLVMGEIIAGIRLSAESFVENQKRRQVRRLSD
jgi:hypothetical protein